MIHPSEQRTRTPPSELDLDGLNAAGVAALLTRQTVRRPRSVAATLDYFGLLARRTDVGRVVAERHGVTARTLTNNVQVVRRAAELVRLPDAVPVELAADSIADDDHLARRRIALVLGLPPPGRQQVRPELPRPHQREPGPLSERTVAGAAGRILAAVGPLTPEALADAIARSQRFRHPDSLDADQLVAGLIRSSTVIRDEDGRFSAAPGIEAPAAYERVVALAGAGPLTRQEMIAVLIKAGYSSTSANGRLSSSHPLFSSDGPDCYRIVR